MILSSKITLNPSRPIAASTAFHLSEPILFYFIARQYRNNQFDPIECYFFLINEFLFYTTKSTVEFKYDGSSLGQI